MKERDVTSEATTGGVLDAATLMGMIGPQGGSKRGAAVAAIAPPRQQTLDDFEFSLGSKQTMQGALNELSADEIDAMFKAMDRGPGVDVRSGRNKMAFDIMTSKRATERATQAAALKPGALSFDYGELVGGPNREMVGTIARNWGRLNMLRGQLPETVKAAEAQSGQESVGTLW